MFAPTRLITALRPRAPVALLASALGVALMFAATPFLIPEVADHFGISEGIAAGLSVVQVGAFAVSTFVAPKLLSPSPRLLRIAASALVLANVASAVAGRYWQLLGFRGLAGGAAGILTWMIWSDAMRHPRHMEGVASAGPVAALVGAPLVALVAGGGDRAVFALLAVALIPAATMAVPAWERSHDQRRVSRSRSNRVLLVALMMLTFGGAGLFVFQAVAARDLFDLTSLQASAAFSLNAAAGLLGARFSTRHRRPGWFLASVGVAAYLSLAGGSPVWFYIGMAWWGFAFWMGVPGVLRMLSARSLEPSERAGDAQAMMAIGRALGPMLGGGFVDNGAYVTLAAVAGSTIGGAGLTVVSVQEGRERLTPSDPRVS